ncbi:MAG: hypothetical protein KAS17_07705 [Victivallaceae bacterium]|nr:hypothetical protein [Victivallaceae bacterium]
MKIGTFIAIATVIVMILIAVSGFTFRQSDQISRHDVRIENLEEDYNEVKEMRKDISCIKESLARLVGSLEKN